MFGALKRGRFRSLASLILVVNVVGELQQKKEHLRHRAVSLRQHGFLVIDDITSSNRSTTHVGLSTKRSFLFAIKTPSIMVVKFGPDNDS